MSFIPLHIRSSYSFLKSGILFKNLFEMAKECGYEELGLTDLGVMYGLPEFVSFAKANNISPILGMDVKCDKYFFSLFIQNETGYSNLSHITSLISKAHLEQKEITFAEILPYLDGLICVLPIDYNVIFKEVNNWFNHVFLTKMAYSRGDVMPKIDSYTGMVKEHVMKCIVYENSTNDFNHWVNEIANFLSIINDFRIKTKTGKLKYEDYLNNGFYNHGNDYRDMNVGLRDFSYNKKYPHFEVTDEMTQKLLNVYTRIAEDCSRIFADKNNEYTHKDFKNLVLDIFEQNNI